MLVPELPISSLGIKRGDQLTVNEKKSATSTGTAPASVPAAPPPDPILQAVVPRTAAPAPRQPASTGPATISTPSGILVHQVVPDDNSCLFTSIGVVFHQDTAAAQKLRRGIVLYYSSYLNVISSPSRSGCHQRRRPLLGSSSGVGSTRDPGHIHPLIAFCRRPREEYIQTILKPSTWGGAIGVSAERFVKFEGVTPVRRTSNIRR